MPNSMTGYGRGTRAGSGLAITVEVRSTNHRYRDISVRLPRELSEFEDRVRFLVAQGLARGHVDVAVALEEIGAGLRTVEVRSELADAYYSAATDLAARLGLPGGIGVEALLMLPEVVALRPASLDVDAAWDALQGALSDAVRAMCEMRASEGVRLAEDVIHRTGQIEQLIARISERSPVVVEEYRARLQARLRDLLADVPIDEGRIAMETAIYAEKSNITEELVRLKSHCEQVRAVMAGVEPAGRRLEFLVQEMHREVNTIGSKSQDVEISRQVVEIKSELEKIREQIQNIE
ncbi:MAG: YicC/YloC family endoribonuclease [Bacillota bacterium]